MTNHVCGTSRIVGCRFNLGVMSDDFVNVILSAIEETDTSKVWKQTDDVSTCIRGRESHVFDVVKAIYVAAAKTGKHVVLNGTFSIGCPGDSEGDVYMTEDDVVLNEARAQDTKLDVSTQFALYPMNTPTYMDVIAAQVNVAKEHGTLTGGVHYATRLDGDVHQVFETLQDSFHNAQNSASHVVMTVNVSANSPSKKAQ
ncbi:YkoF family thiamine/hydroxymethylpyrimidine-binding protein [Bacillus sp. CGMCC 1.16541]|uniref:YkoF family thiamine/hydroxymethylpyrimidine-binding protein n=1 Tax=Bacillus sp. CGMCC 1.16541 TaxID=2185143 RepID=UPI000D73455F|nr:YkoF family thiamine/hydroxymethylpyrimidine-binding protein [Bacillus sp. CGMCC 1.16541]